MTDNAKVKKRALAQDKSESGVSNGKIRQKLYARLLKRINEGIENGFYLESVTLEESFIGDRLESYCIFKNDKSKPNQNLGSLLRQLKIDSDFPEDLWIEIDTWRNGRNHALHEMAKFAAGEDADWNEKYQKAESVAKMGVKLLRKVDLGIRKLHKK